MTDQMTEIAAYVRRPLIEVSLYLHKMMVLIALQKENISKRKSEGKIFDKKESNGKSRNPIHLLNFQTL